MIVYRAWSMLSLLPSSQLSWQLSTVFVVAGQLLSSHSAVPDSVVQKQLFAPYLVMSHTPPASMQLSLPYLVMSHVPPA